MKMYHVGEVPEFKVLPRSNISINQLGWPSTLSTDQEEWDKILQAIKYLLKKDPDAKEYIVLSFERGQSIYPYNVVAIYKILEDNLMIPIITIFYE